MSDQLPELTPAAAFAAEALLIAARTPGAMVLAFCKDKQTGENVATLCMLSADRLIPFAVVPDDDLRTILEPPTDCMAPQLAAPPSRIGFDTRRN